MFHYRLKQFDLETKELKLILTNNAQDPKDPNFVELCNLFSIIFNYPTVKTFYLKVKNNQNCIFIKKHLGLFVSLVF